MVMGQGAAGQVSRFVLSPHQQQSCKLGQVSENILEAQFTPL